MFHPDMFILYIEHTQMLSGYSFGSDVKHTVAFPKALGEVDLSLPYHLSKDHLIVDNDARDLQK